MGAGANLHGVVVRSIVPKVNVTLFKAVSDLGQEISRQNTDWLCVRKRMTGNKYYTSCNKQSLQMAEVEMKLWSCSLAPEAKVQLQLC